jgi:hypothetical protein
VRVISGVGVGVASSGEVVLNLRPKKKAKAKRPMTIIKIKKVITEFWFLAGAVGVSSSAMPLLYFETLICQVLIDLQIFGFSSIITPNGGEALLS